MIQDGRQQPSGWFMQQFSSPGYAVHQQPNCWVPAPSTLANPPGYAKRSSYSHGVPPSAPHGLARTESSLSMSSVVSSATTDHDECHTPPPPPSAHPMAWAAPQQYAAPQYSQLSTASRASSRTLPAQDRSTQSPAVLAAGLVM